MLIELHSHILSGFHVLFIAGLRLHVLHPVTVPVQVPAPHPNVSTLIKSKYSRGPRNRILGVKLLSFLMDYLNYT